MKELKQKAIDLFLKNTHYVITDINKTRRIHNGYTNYSYYFQTSDFNEYQVRISKQTKNVDRKVELEFLKTINNKDYKYFDEKTGNAIKVWIKGKTVPFKQASKLVFINKLVEKIENLHAIAPNDNIPVHDYFEYVKKSDLPEKYMNLYQKLTNIHCHGPYVMSHNDINPLNIILGSKKSINLIDYEWGRLNTPWWDLINYIRELNLSHYKIRMIAYDNELNPEDVKEQIYICTCYAYMWTFYMPEDEMILKYREQLKLQIEDYYTWITTNPKRK